MRQVLSDETRQKQIAAEKYSFIGTNELFRRSMDVAYEEFKWKIQPL